MLVTFPMNNIGNGSGRQEEAVASDYGHLHVMSTDHKAAHSYRVPGSTRHPAIFLTTYLRRDFAESGNTHCFYHTSSQSDIIFQPQEQNRPRNAQYYFEFNGYESHHLRPWCVRGVWTTVSGQRVSVLVFRVGKRQSCITFCASDTRDTSWRSKHRRHAQYGTYRRTIRPRCVSVSGWSRSTLHRAGMTQNGLRVGKSGRALVRNVAC